MILLSFKSLRIEPPLKSQIVSPSQFCLLTPRGHCRSTFSQRAQCWHFVTDIITEGGCCSSNETLGGAKSIEVWFWCATLRKGKRLIRVNFLIIINGELAIQAKSIKHIELCNIFSFFFKTFICGDRAKIIIPEAAASGLKHGIKETAEAWLSTLQRPSEGNFRGGPHDLCCITRRMTLTGIEQRGSTW